MLAYLVEGSSSTSSLNSLVNFTPSRKGKWARLGECSN